MAKEGQEETLAEIRMECGGILQLQRFEGLRVRLIYAKGPDGSDCFPTRDEAAALADALVRVFVLGCAGDEREMFDAVLAERQAEIDRNNALRLPRPADSLTLARTKEKLDAAQFRRRGAVDKFREGRVF